MAAAASVGDGSAAEWDPTSVGDLDTWIDATPGFKAGRNEDTLPSCVFDTSGPSLNTTRQVYALDLHTSHPGHATIHGISAPQSPPGHTSTGCLFDRLELTFGSVSAASVQAYTEVDTEATVIRWLLDSGCNQSMTKRKDILDRLKTRRMLIQGISTAPEAIDTVGTIKGSILDVEGRSKMINIGDVAHSPSSPMNLLATSALVNRGAVVHLERGNCYLRLPGKDGSMACVPIEEENGLYILRLEHVAPIRAIRDAYSKEKPELTKHGHPLVAAASMNLWHERLNHTNKDTIRIMYDKGVAEGWKLPKGKYKHDSKCKCDACSIARASSAATPNQRRFLPRYQRPFAIVSSDLKGPLPPAFGGFRYSVTYICEVSRLAYVYYMKRKSETPDKLEEFLAHVKADGYAPPAELRTDFTSRPRTRLLERSPNFHVSLPYVRNTRSVTGWPLQGSPASTASSNGTTAPSTKPRTVTCIELGWPPLSGHSRFNTPTS